MRIYQALAFAAAATLSLSACAEGTVAPSAAGNTVLVQAGVSPLYRLTPMEAQQMRGSFRLDDGRTLTVTNRSSKLFVELDGKREELLAVGPKKFVTRDGTRVTFNQVPYADEVVVNHAVR